ncbi:MAG TPA: hypothetical protein VK145_00290 [Candidatus Nanoarchaeia archaeon]|nr:hypothetical protein [Candidatus Nanoarchaeia archaeon]
MFTGTQANAVQFMVESLVSQVALAGTQGCKRELLCAMARVLQAELSDAANWPEIPLGPGLEVLMRAVAAGIENDPTSDSYIREKVEHGIRATVGRITRPLAA